MRKVNLLIAFVLILCTTASANSSELFSYDSKKIDQDFQLINELEVMVNDQGVTINDLSFQNGEFYDELLSDGYSTMSPEMVQGMGIHWGSFFWGLFCCPVGFFTVVLNADRSGGEKRSYWFGVIVSVVLGAAGYGTQVL
jgi:hypothetical protein